MSMPINPQLCRLAAVSFACTCLHLFSAPPAVLAAAKPSASSGPKSCDAAFYEKLRSPVSKGDDSIRVDCNIELGAKEALNRKLVFAGEAASGTTLDCGGATIGSKAVNPSPGSPTIAIRSIKKGKGTEQTWSVPRGITIRNCRIIGSLRLIGLGATGEAEEVRKSSLNRDHTEFAQASAPSNIVLSDLTFVTEGAIPLYLGPGVTKTTVANSTFLGSTNKTAVYLDAESAENVIDRNVFKLETKYREVIAVDGSAKNRISNNIFENPVNGGIWVYRNCGEGGTIRHQKPQYNEIIANRFVYKSTLARPAIWLNHRDIGKLTCKIDPKYPFGSSLDYRDFAKHNLVKDNRFEGPWSLRIINFDDTNRIVGNR